MTRARKDKRQHKDSAAEQRARVVKSGIYNGANSTQDFVVSGHSTGSPYSEMEALSIQNSIDAGNFPDYNPNDSVPDLKTHGFGATADLDGPEFYGDYPPLTGDGDLSLSALRSSGEKSAASHLSNLPYGKIALWSGVGLVGTALAYLGFKYYSERPPEPIFEY